MYVNPNVLSVSRALLNLDYTAGSKPRIEGSNGYNIRQVRFICRSWSLLYLLILAQLFNTIFDDGGRFILVILPPGSTEEIHRQVKHSGDVLLGVATQCVVSVSAAMACRTMLCSYICGANVKREVTRYSKQTNSIAAILRWSQFSCINVCRYHTDFCKELTWGWEGWIGSLPAPFLNSFNVVAPWF